MKIGYGSSLRLGVVIIMCFFHIELYAREGDIVQEAGTKLDSMRADFNEFYANMLQGKCEGDVPDETQCVQPVPGKTPITAAKLSQSLNEEVFFQNARAQQVNFMKCDIQKLNKMMKRDVSSLDFQETILNDIGMKLPELRIQYEASRSTKKTLDDIDAEIFGLHAGVNRSLVSPQEYDKKIKILNEKRDAAYKAWKPKADKFNILYSSLWRSDEPAMEDFLDRLIKSKRDPKELMEEALQPEAKDGVIRWATGTREFSFQEQVLNKIVESTKKDLEKLNAPGEMSFSTKKMLVENSEWTNHLPEGSREANHSYAKLMCTLDKKYVSGDKLTTDTALGLSLFAGGSGVFTRLFSAGKFARLLSGGGLRAMLSASKSLTVASVYLGAPLAIDEIRQSCFDTKSDHVYGEKTCNAHQVENFHEVERKRVEQENCVLALTMGAAIATPSVLKYVEKFKKLAGKLPIPDSARLAYLNKMKKYEDELNTTEVEEIVVVARRPAKTVKELPAQLKNFSPESKKVIAERLNGPNDQEFLKIMGVLEHNVDDPKKLNYIFDELAGYSALSKQQKKKAFEKIVLTVKKWDPDSLQGKYIAFKERQFENKLKKTEEIIRKKNPDMSEAEVLQKARAETILRKERALELKNKCTSWKPNEASMKAATFYGGVNLTFGVGTTGATFAIANWNDVKDLTWAKRLGYEVAMAYAMAKWGAKVSSNQKRSMGGKIVESMIVSDLVAFLEAGTYSTFFANDKKKAETHLQNLMKSPDFKKDMLALDKYLEERSQIEKVVDEVGDSYNNFLKIVTGKEKIEELSPAEISKLEQTDLKDPIILEKLMDTIEDQLYSEELGGKTYGNELIDRAMFDIKWNLTATPRGALVGLLSYRAVCQNLDNPMKAIAAFGAIQGVNKVGASLWYYNKKSNEINQ